MYSQSIDIVERLDNEKAMAEAIINMAGKPLGFRNT